MESKRCGGVLIWCLVFLLVVSYEVQADDLNCDRGYDQCVSTCKTEKKWGSLRANAHCMIFCSPGFRIAADKKAQEQKEEILSSPRKVMN